MAFVKARRDQAWLRLLLWGEAGGGKSYTALLLLSLMVAEMLGHPEWVLLPRDGEPGQPKVSPELEGHIAVIDGEARLREYAGGAPFWFCIEEPQDFRADTLLPIIDDVRRSGFKAVLFDPFSHVWQGQGGTLQQHSELGGSFKDWGPAKSAYRSVLNGLLSLDCHVIATARAKVERVIEGKHVVTNGLQAIGEEGVEYEFSLVGRMSAGGVLNMIKSVASTIGTGEVYDKPSRQVATRLIQWLSPGSADDGGSAYTEVKRMVLEASTPEAAILAKQAFLDESKAKRFTLRETGILKGLLSDAAKRLGLSKAGGA